MLNRKITEAMKKEFFKFDKKYRFVICKYFERYDYMYIIFFLL